MPGFWAARAGEGSNELVPDTFFLSDTFFLFFLSVRASYPIVPLTNRGFARSRLRSPVRQSLPPRHCGAINFCGEIMIDDRLVVANILYRTAQSIDRARQRTCRPEGAGHAC